MRSKATDFHRLYPTLPLLATAALLAALLPAHAAGQGEASRAGEETAQIQEAVRIYKEEGKAAQAIEMLDAFLKMHPESPLADDALVEQSRIYRASGDLRKAAGAVNRLLKDYPASTIRGTAFLELAKTYEADREWKDCIESAGTSLTLELSPDQRSEALLTRSACWLARDKAGPAARDAVEAYRAAPGDAARRGAAEAVRAAARTMDASEIEAFYRSSDGSTPYAFAAEIEVERAIEEGRDREGVNMLMDLMVHYPEALPPERAAELFAPIKDRIFARTNVIGALLPLTGQYGVYGEKALQGIQAALGMLSPMERHRTGAEFVLEVQDTAGDPAKAAQAARDLAERDHVLAIIGPVFSRTTRAAAEVAEKAGVPLISLSPDPAVPRLGAHIFRRSLTDRQQVQALIRLAHDRLGMTRFAFLYADSLYGREMMNLFWDELDQRGAKVVGAEGFPPGQSDFGPQIRALVGLNRTWTPEEQALKEADPKYEIPPIVDFDALFVPADFSTVGLLAPQLAYYEVNEILLLGTDAWNNPWLTELGESHVEGAVFTAAFLPGADDPAAREMAERYFMTFGQDPQELAVQAYDAALIVRKGVEAGLVKNRADLQEYLGKLKDFPSAEGPLTADEEGDLVQRPYLLTVESGRIVPLVLEVD